MTTPAVAASDSGLVVVDKPGGLTSHDVVARVRRLARTRKVGHAGTLDPMATGVLVLGVNKGTRLLGHLALTEKSYLATVRLGTATSTDDADGEVVSTAPVDALDERLLRSVLDGFVGDIEQVPSAVSAVKVDGQRAYRRVRAGEEVTLPSRPVTIHELTVDGVSRSGASLDVRISVRCSSGTYIRAIARDLGVALGVGGHLTSLRRTTVGAVGLRDATPLGDLEDAGSVRLMGMEEAVSRFFPVVSVDREAARDVGFGRPLAVELATDGPVALLAPDGRFLALYRRSAGAGSAARPVAVFL